jgi:tetratricopeptide (TPR) repeat protein
VEVADGLVYPLSVFNQGALFFKYLGLWLMPNPLWMSVDMREPFVTSFWVWPQTLGFAAFVVYPLVSFALMWRGGRLGLLGFGLLAPWLLFATEISTVRIQEQFVLYRSYLWAAPAFSILIVLAGGMVKRRSVLLLALIALVMFPLAYQRLQTFSHPFLLWDDAARLVEGKGDRTGLARIYFNRGHEFEALGLSEKAVADYTRALEEKSNYYRPYLLSDRGASYISLKRYLEALRDFNEAISLNNGNARTYMGRGLALEGLNQPEVALQSFRSACQLGWQAACKKLQ